MSKDDESRLMAVELAKRLLVDAIWKTASIEVDGISFRDTQEIFEGRAPANMAVDDIIVVNNIKRAWMFLFENVDQPVNWAIHVRIQSDPWRRVSSVTQENSGPMMCASEEPIGSRSFRPWNLPMTGALH